MRSQRSNPAADLPWCLLDTLIKVRTKDAPHNWRTGTARWDGNPWVSRQKPDCPLIFSAEREEPEGDNRAERGS
jgi:hypothetical protein